MNLIGIPVLDLVGIIVGLFLTLSIFSYIFGDNGLFRLATHIFIGVSAGYLALISWTNIIWPKLLAPAANWDGTTNTILPITVPLVLSLMLLGKLVPKLSTIGSPVMAYLAGAGAAVAIGGAITGTLIPQVISTINVGDLSSFMKEKDLFWPQIIEGAIIIAATISTLIFFQFSARKGTSGELKRGAGIESIARIGKFFIAITLGALFGGVLTAALSALVERWHWIYLSLLALIQS